MNAKFKFHNVGQGLFYSGQIGSLNIVFDCGYENAKHAELIVIDYLKLLENNPIDLLFISHFHEDHFIGIDFLKQNNVSFKKVVMPYLTKEERLLCAGSSIKPSQNYLQFLENPSVYFSDAEQIIYITDDGILSNTWADTIVDFNENNDGYKIIFQFENSNIVDPELLLANESVQFFNHFGRIGIFKKENIIWTFKVYCHKPHNKKYTVFKDNVCRKILNIKNFSFARSISAYHTILYGCYQTLWKDLNITSLAVLHTPKFPDYIAEGTQNGFFDNVLSCICHVKSDFYCFPATLLLGDIKLDYSIKGVILERFFEHFNQDLKNVGVVQLSHHGSDNGWNSIMYNKLKNARFICSASLYSKKHPNAFVTSSIITNKLSIEFVHEYQYYYYSIYCNNLNYLFNL